jgi:hypothetical protein
MTPINETGDETLSFGPAPTLAIGGGIATGNTATVETVTPGSTSLSSRPEAGRTSAPESSANPPADSSTADPNSAQPAKNSTPAQPADKSLESTSKKKKGVHKLIPW